MPVASGARRPGGPWAVDALKFCLLLSLLLNAARGQEQQIAELQANNALAVEVHPQYAEISEVADGSTVEVANDVQLLAAVKNPFVSLVVMTADIKLGPSWDFSLTLTVHRNVTIRGRRSFPRLDFDYKECRVLLANNAVFRFEGVEILRPRRSLPATKIGLICDHSSGSLIVTKSVYQMLAGFHPEVTASRSTSMPRPDGKTNMVVHGTHQWCKTDPLPDVTRSRDWPQPQLTPAQLAAVRQGEPDGCWRAWVMVTDVMLDLEKSDYNPLYEAPEAHPKKSTTVYQISNVLLVTSRIVPTSCIGVRGVVACVEEARTEVLRQLGLSQDKGSAQRGVLGTIVSLISAGATGAVLLMLLRPRQRAVPEVGSPGPLSTSTHSLLNQGLASLLASGGSSGKPASSGSTTARVVSGASSKSKRRSASEPAKSEPSSQMAGALSLQVLPPPGSSALPLDMLMGPGSLAAQVQLNGHGPAAREQDAGVQADGRRGSADISTAGSVKQQGQGEGLAQQQGRGGSPQSQPGSPDTDFAAQLAQAAGAASQPHSNPPSGPAGASVLQDIVRAHSQLLGSKESNRLVMGRLLGRGASAAVYQGRWRNLDVAVKCVIFSETWEPTGPAAVAAAASATAGDSHRQRVVTEAAVAASMEHENVVATLHFDVKPIRISHTQPDEWDPAALHIEEDTGDGDTPTHPRDFKLFLVQELCNMSLSDAIQSLVLHHKGLHGALVPNVPKVLHLLHDIASGMAHIHSKNIIHGDLKCQNVLIKMTPDTPFRLTAKVADFGLSRVLPTDPGVTHVSNVNQGTPFYVAPEVCQSKKLTKASDSFSFGVLAWETLTGIPPYTRLDSGSYVYSQAYIESFSQWPASPMQTLIRGCLLVEPKQRPTMTEIEATLREMMKEPLAAVGCEPC